MSFEPIKRILPQAIQSAGISRQVTAARVIEEAARVILRLWGEERVKYISIVSFKEGTLKINVLAPVALQELRQQKILFQNELNRALGAKIVMSLQMYLS